MKTKESPLSEPCPKRINNAAHFPVTAQVGNHRSAFCNNCHAALNYDEAASAIKSHYEERYWTRVDGNMGVR